MLNDFDETLMQCSGAALVALSIKLQGGFYFEGARYDPMRDTATVVP